MFAISNSTMLLILAMSFLATNVLANLTGRDSILDYVTAFSTLYIGALLGNSLLSEIEIAGTSELAQSAISANIGMTIAALIIAALHGRAKAI